MADTPTQLRNIRDKIRSGRFGQRSIWENQLEGAAAEIEKLRAALKPFADAAVGLTDDDEDDEEIWERPVGMDILIGDLRRAATALEQKAGDPDEGLPTANDVRGILATEQKAAPSAVSTGYCPRWPGCGCGTQSGPHTCEWEHEQSSPMPGRGQTEGKP